MSYATRVSEAAPAPNLTLHQIEDAIASMGERIQARRKVMGLTLEQVAERAGMSKSYVWEIENGENKNPTIRTAFLIARALGWTLSDIVGVWEHAALLHPEAMKIATQVDILLRPASAETPKDRS
jgi:transcriptional regulator with XRE-family HTH domain